MDTLQPMKTSQLFCFLQFKVWKNKMKKLDIILNLVKAISE